MGAYRSTCFTILRRPPQRALSLEPGHLAGTEVDLPTLLRRARKCGLLGGLLSFAYLLSAFASYLSLKSHWRSSSASVLFRSIIRFCLAETTSDPLSANQHHCFLIISQATQGMS